MKKFLVLGAVGLLLAGCSDAGQADDSKTAEEPGSALEENAVNTPAENENDAERQAAEKGDVNASENSSRGDSNESADTGHTVLEKYEEYSTVRANAPVDGLTGIVETDNPGTRVILYEDASGVKKVKSIYVKKENRLKVISLNDDGLLYNDILN